MRPFTPSGSSYQEKPQQSYGYDDGIDDGQQGFSPEARGFVPRSKSQDKTAQAKPEAVKTDKDASAQKDAESSVKGAEQTKAPARRTIRSSLMLKHRLKSARTFQALSSLPSNPRVLSL